MTRIIGFAVLVFILGWCNSAWAQSDGICYDQGECECIFANKGLRDGRWQAKTAPGSFVSSEGNVTAMIADEIDLEITSHCDGKLEVSWNDREAGQVDWELYRYSKGSVMPEAESASIAQIDTGLWNDFSKVSTELDELAQDNEIYHGATTYTVQGTTVPATMIFAYSGLPGNAAERGWASITVRLGPFGRHTFWGRTGKVDLFWVAETDALIQRRYEKCGCEQIDRLLASNDLSIRLQKALRDRTEGLKMRRTGYGDTLDQMVRRYFNNGDPFTEMMNDRFDRKQPISAPTDANPSNWPCVPRSQIQNLTATDQTQYAVDFDKALPGAYEKLDAIVRRVGGKPPVPADPHRKPAKGKTGAETKVVSCKIEIVDYPGTCPLRDIVKESFFAHEKVHQDKCLSRNSKSLELKSDLEAVARGEKVVKGKKVMKGVTREAAESMVKQKPWECLTYQKYTANSYYSAVDELSAYKAGREPLEKFHATYCSGRP